MIILFAPNPRKGIRMETGEAIEIAHTFVFHVKYIENNQFRFNVN